MDEVVVVDWLRACLDAGADYFFIKSTEFNQVVPALNRLIQQAGDAARLGAQKDPGMQDWGHG